MWKLENKVALGNLGTHNNVVQSDTEYVSGDLGPFCEPTSGYSTRTFHCEDCGVRVDSLSDLEKTPCKTRKACSWRERDGVIYFSVTSDGTSGRDWIARLEKKGFRLSNFTKYGLNSSNFKATAGIMYEIAVLKGELFTNADRIIRNIRAEGARRKFFTLNAEIACLIREKFTDAEIEAMGLVWLIVMHEHIADSLGDLSLLAAVRGVSGCGFGACDILPIGMWCRDRGFAFAVAQISASVSGA